MTHQAGHMRVGLWASGTTRRPGHPTIKGFRNRVFSPILLNPARCALESRRSNDSRRRSSEVANQLIIGKEGHTFEQNMDGKAGSKKKIKKIATPVEVNDLKQRKKAVVHPPLSHVHHTDSGSESS